MKNLDENTLTRQAYELHNVKYSIYQIQNEFYGTPIPEGYEAIYINDGITFSSLKLKKISNNEKSKISEDDQS